MQTDIAKYAMWLFNRSGNSDEQLPDLYDQLCSKNPIRSEAFSFQDFEALFRQWRWQQLACSDVAPGSVDADPAQPVFADKEDFWIEDEPANTGMTPGIVKPMGSHGIEESMRSPGIEEQILSPGTAEPMQMLSPDTAPICDYHVVTEMLIEQLVVRVKCYLAEGWTPLGGISRATSASSASYWAQAMVKRQVN